MKKSIWGILLILCSSLFAFDQGDILSPEEAFKVEATKQKDVIHTVITLGEGIYIYDEALHYTITEPKEILLDDEIQRPEPVNYHDFIVHRMKEVVVDIPLSLVKDKIGEGTFTLKIDYQGCSEKGLCYQPLSQTFAFDTTASAQEQTDAGSAAPTWKSSGSEAETKTVTTTEKIADEVISEEDQIVNTLRSGSVSTILALFFGFGLLLALTPCIFPMIPILSSIIVSQSGDGKEQMSASKGFFLSLVYVLSMSIAYTIAGVFAGIFGANIQTALQNPWVITVFALIFVALALSMFGYYEIQLPAKLQSKINKTSDDAKGKAGIIGVAVMGFLSALIVGPCVAPALAGALVYIGQTGDALLGGAALFAMSIGMGIPLLVVGAGAGKFMPRPGGWMTLVSQVFGVVMLGIAIWMISRIIPGPIALFLWAVLFIGSGVYSGAFEGFKEGVKGSAKLIKVFALILVFIGAIFLVGSFSGASNPLNPLEKFGQCSPIVETKSETNSFKKVKNLAALEQEIANSQKPVLIDFSAEWCASCKELEHITFPDAKVASLMRSFTLLKVDVTKNSDDDKVMLKRYNVFGPPAIIFYDKAGNEMKNYKTIGYKSPEVFSQILENVLGNS